MKTLIISFLCFIGICTANAQLTFNCAGKKYTIPEFKEHTSEKNIWEEEFETLGILQPVELSKFDIELRCYYDVVAPSFGSAIIIKGDTNKIFAEAYYYCFQRNTADSIPPEGFKVIKHGGRNIYYSVKTVSVPDTLLEALIKHHLFSRQNTMELADSLKKQGIKIERSNALLSL